MLKALFSSKTRIKLLKTFLLNPDEEYFVRELTRNLDDQINGIRRELENLKKIGLLKFRNKDRKKHYFANKEFLLYPELRSIFLKTLTDKKDIASSIAGLGKVDFLLLSGIFVSNSEDAQVDMLIVGDVDRDALSDLVEVLSENNEEIRYSLMTTENFQYRIQYKDSFVLSLLNDKKNTIAINKLKKFLKSS